MKFYELLILVFGCISLIDLIKDFIIEKTNSDLFALIGLLGSYKTSYLFKQMVEKLLVIICIVYLVWKIFM